MSKIPRTSTYTQVKNLGELDGKTLQEVVIDLQTIINAYPQSKLTVSIERSYDNYDEFCVYAQTPESDEEYEKRCVSFRKAEAKRRLEKKHEKKKKEEAERALFLTLKAKYES